MRAALLSGVNEPLEIVDDLVLNDLGPTDVRVRIAASGVCHSDLSAITGVLPHPLPCVLGHEGAGEIIGIGPAVSRVAVGDHVVLSWVPPCGHCFWCDRDQPHLCDSVGVTNLPPPRYRRGSDHIWAGIGVGSFAEEAVVDETAAVPIPEDVPFEIAALVGCGVTTGVGAAINTADVEAGSSVLVIGCGGVGINVIQGSVLAGAATIVAVDQNEAKLDTAKRFGATAAITPDEIYPAVREHTAGRGFDYAFEVVGVPDTIRAAWDATRRGGTTVIVGAGRLDERVSFNCAELFVSGRELKGCIYGSANVNRDFGRFLDLWRAGRLDLDGLITARIPLTGVNAAFDHMRAGDGIRSVVVFD